MLEGLLPHAGGTFTPCWRDFYPACGAFYPTLEGLLPRVWGLLPHAGGTFTPCWRDFYLACGAFYPMLEGLLPRVWGLLPHVWGLLPHAGGTFTPCWRDFYPRVWGKKPLLPPHTCKQLLNKINNLNDLFSHNICCSINVQYNVYIFLQLYILEAVNSTFFLKEGGPLAPLYPTCKCICNY